MPQTLRDKLRQEKPPVERYPPRVHQCQVQTYLNQHQLAQLLGITPLTARRILSGCDLKLSQALLICRHLNLQVGDLWPRSRG